MKSSIHENLSCESLLTRKFPDLRYIDVIEIDDSAFLCIMVILCLYLYSLYSSTLFFSTISSHRYETNWIHCVQFINTIIILLVEYCVAICGSWFHNKLYQCYSSCHLYLCLSSRIPVSTNTLHDTHSLLHSIT